MRNEEDHKRLYVYVDENAFALTNANRIAAQSVLRAAHHGTKQFTLFHGGAVQFGILGNLKTEHISCPPGWRLRFFADFFYSPKTMERIVDPIIADLQGEYCKALSENQSVKAAWIRIGAGWILFKALGLYAGAKNIAGIWKIARRT